MKKTDTLMSPDMARAWAEGSKCRTQRVITKLKGHGKITEFGLTDTAHYKWHFRDKRMLWNDILDERLYELCPYGQPGDRLRLLTTWAVNRDWDEIKPSRLSLDLYPEEIWTEFDGSKPDWCGKKRPGRFMTLQFRVILPTPKILSIEARRIKEITDHECIEEGIDPRWVAARGYEDARVAFRMLWNALNAKRGYPWESNPWVWNIRFQSAEEAGWNR